MTDSRTHLGSPVNRKTSIAAGIGLLIVGAPILLLGIVAILRLPSKGIDSFPFAVVAVFLAIGTFCVSTALRMIFGRKRLDGGLFSPFVLRTAGVLFAVMPVILILADGLNLLSLWTLLEIGFFFAAAGSCFVLANKRQYPTLGQENANADQ